MCTCIGTVQHPLRHCKHGWKLPLSDGQVATQILRRSERRSLLSFKRSSWFECVMQRCCFQDIRACMHRTMSTVPNAACKIPARMLEAVQVETLALFRVPETLAKTGCRLHIPPFRNTTIVTRKFQQNFNFPPGLG